jgi:hypothetical protein
MEDQMSRKEEIINGLVEARKRIIETASKLPSEAQNQVFLGTWNIKDLLAHLIGWDYTNIEAVTDIRSAISPRAFEYWDPDWKKYNATLVETHKNEKMAKLLLAIQISHQTLIDFLAEIPAEDIEKDFGIRSPDGTHITAEWWLQYEIDDEGRHLKQIQDWIAEVNPAGSE